MVKWISILILILFYFATFPLSAQEKSDTGCTVLMESISETYEGDCKNGLAHGKGFAVGKDTFKGRFKKGLPHGWGKYTWKNGDSYEGKWKNGEKHGKGTYIDHIENGKDTVLKGYWKKDTFKEKLNPENLKGYTVNFKKNIEAVYIYKAGLGKDIHVILKRGNRRTPDRIVTLIGSSGVTNMGGRYGLGYEEVVFPFYGQVKFTASTFSGLGIKRCELDFTIEKEGTWYVEIQY